MATKFLDYTGLSHLWSKFKEWCNFIFVTKATDENITGTKTFVGSKKIAFKQSGANDKLGFTLFNNSGNEQGYLEYNPTNKIAGVPLMTLGNYATATNELTYVGFRRYSNISGASGAYNLLTPLISDAKSHFNLTTTYTNFYLPLGISDGINVVTADNGGVVNISSLLPSVSTIGWSNITSKPTTISGYGITDAKIDNGTITLGSNTITPLTSHQTLPTLSRTISGSGNAITDITVSGHAITATKDTTFLTSHQTLPVLSLTTSGSGNAITALSVNDHEITVTKGASYITSSGSITGNAATATKLATACSLWGNTFDGSSNVSGPIVMTGYCAIKNSSLVKGTVPSSVQYITLNLCDKNGQDYSPNTLGQFETRIDSNNIVYAYIRALKNEANSTAKCEIACVYDTNNNIAYTQAPTPTTSDNSTKIATTAFVKNQGYLTAHQSLDSCVKTSGNQTINGTKTFSSVLVFSTDFVIRRNVDNSATIITGSTDLNASHINMYGKSHSTQGGNILIRASNGTNTKDMWLSSNGTLQWNGQTVQTTSDERLKTSLQNISSDILDSWSEVQWGEFQYLEAVKEKGENARYHIGLIAQSVDRVFKNHDKNILKYGILCHEESKATEDEPAKDLWMVRYTEALCMEAAYQRRKNKILETRISELETQVQNMLQVLESLKGA